MNEPMNTTREAGARYRLGAADHRGVYLFQ
jgi:hypothetical protein